ncbi:MAG: C13 family peptidase [Gammaproteobacteria bacterium]
MYRLLHNLGQGARLAVLRPPRPEPGIGQLVLLVALGWACALGVDWTFAPPEAQPSPWGWATEAARSYLWIAVLAVLSACDRGRLPFLPLAVAIAAAELVLWVAWMALMIGGPRIAPVAFANAQTYLGHVMLGWQVALLLPAIKAVGGPLAPRHLVHATVYALVLLANQHWLPDYPLFDAPDPGEARVALNVEAIYARQPELLDQALRRVTAGVPGRPELFVVTFAGFGAEDVFRREAEQVAHILARRYGAGTRALRLLNHPDTLARHPLASGTNLAYALRALGRKMQDEDVLFLFMTSHGSEEGEFAVELGDLGLNALTPQALRTMLDEAGIRWRVLVVSACYSGQFIDALASRDTLLITAAARDRASFGCAHERAWTYFGEAYFRHALSRTRSFTRAFGRASSLIARRERREGKVPSEPQMRLGEAIAPALEALERRFD